ncbi:ubiquinol-cytochrome C chaperone family protein [Azospirillum oleiclasticum]
MVSLLDRLFGRRRGDERADMAFYAAVVTQARQPGFYADLRVPDTLDGRFELIALHVFLVMRRLKGQGATADQRARRLYEVMIDEFDTSLREMGAGDTGIGRRVKTMLRGMHGRIIAYDKALADPDPRHLEVALDNNLYGTVRAVDPAHLAAMAGYARATAAALEALPVERIVDGELRFVPVPAGAMTGVSGC